MLLADSCLAWMSSFACSQTMHACTTCQCLPIRRNTTVLRSAPCCMLDPPDPACAQQSFIKSHITTHATAAFLLSVHPLHREAPGQQTACTDRCTHHASPIVQAQSPITGNSWQRPTDCYSPAMATAGESTKPADPDPDPYLDS